MESLEVPQWKKDLIARLRSQNKRFEAAVDERNGGPHQFVASCDSPRMTLVSGNSYVLGEAPDDVDKVVKPQKSPKMVQERMWLGEASLVTEQNGKNSDSDSSEDLRYGPGIVSKLKSKYLSLALREHSKTRPSILHLRKAASLENILDEEPPKPTPKPAPKPRYRPSTRPQEMKRARSVETISRHPLNDEDPPPTTTTTTPSQYQRINRPKRITPLIKEKEKPPSDVVKQAKMFFERHPNQRGKKPPLTGDVAAKVDTFNNIINSKPIKKPQVKVKPQTTPPRPLILADKPFKPAMTPPMTSPIPDVFHVKDDKPKSGLTTKSNLSETPDLILTTSPLISNLQSPNLIKSSEKFLKEERSSEVEFIEESISPLGVKAISPTSQSNIAKPSSTVFNFLHSNGELLPPPSPINKNVLQTKTPPSQPLKIDVNGTSKEAGKVNNGTSSNLLIQEVKKKPLTATELEKNIINTVKTLQTSPQAVNRKVVEEVDGTLPSGKNGPVLISNSVEVKNLPEKNVVKPTPGARKSRGSSDGQAITAVYNFTSRKDVPDYISQDLSRTPHRPELPKTGEGGIILIPGASLSESFTDEDDELLRSLEAPPSPCDVTFVNDNILIDGKSSLSQKTKKSKMRISFVDAGPEVFEYPSETSMMMVVMDESQGALSNAQVGHQVPILTGSTLANYTPKGTEDFQPGVTRAILQDTPPTKSEEVPSIKELLEEPIQFSAGTNADILF